MRRSLHHLIILTFITGAVSLYAEDTDVVALGE